MVNDGEKYLLSEIAQSAEDAAALSKCKVDGWYSWLVCFIGFMVEFIVFGFYLCYGVIFYSLVEEYKTKETVAAWIGSISLSICFALSPVVNKLCNIIGYRAVAVLGGFLFGAGLFLTSVVEETVAMTITYGLIFGTGCSLCHFTAVLVQPKFFKRKRPLALGVATAGCGMGAFVIGYFMEISIQTYGLRMTFRLFSLLAIPLCLGPLLYSPNQTKSQYSKVNPATEKPSGNRAPSVVPVWKNKAMIAHAASLWVYGLAYYSPSVHLVNMAETINIPRNQATILPSVIAMGQSIGRLISGQVMVFFKDKLLPAHQFFFLLAAVATALCPLAQSFPSLVAYAFVFGFADGFDSITTLLITEMVTGEEGMEAGYVLHLSGMAVTVLVGPPLTGWLYLVSGAYDIPFYCCSAFILICILLTFGVNVFHINNNQNGIIHHRLIKSAESLPSLESAISNSTSYSLLKPPLSPVDDIHAVSNEFSHVVVDTKSSKLERDHEAVLDNYQYWPINGFLGFVTNSDTDKEAMHIVVERLTSV